MYLAKLLENRVEKLYSRQNFLLTSIEDYEKRISEHRVNLNEVEEEIIELEKSLDEIYSKEDK